MWKAEKWIQSAIGALIGTAIITVFTGSWSTFLFRWLTSIIPTRIITCFLFEREKPSKGQKAEQTKSEPFIVSEYYGRIEKAALNILEDQKPVDQIIILWWGLDGLRLNDDGSLEWISRKKPEPVNQNVFYQSAQSMAQARPPFDYSMFQSTQAQINALQTQNTVFQMQAAQQAQNMAMMAAFTSLYPSYSGFQQGLIAGTFPLTGCCCDQTILR